MFGKRQHPGDDSNAFIIFFSFFCLRKNSLCFNYSACKWNSCMRPAYSVVLLLTVFWCSGLRSLIHICHFITNVYVLLWSRLSFVLVTFSFGLGMLNNYHYLLPNPPNKQRMDLFFWRACKLCVCVLFRL